MARLTKTGKKDTRNLMEMVMAGVDTTGLNFYEAFFEEFHISNVGGQIWDFLGLSVQEYQQWVDGTKTLVQIAAERRGT